ncbi:MAG: hypothetical protein JXB35_10255 [Anaerolineae bacterium]|nr:hypothetical protein [Anaerolineae bacterium]
MKLKPKSWLVILGALLALGVLGAGMGAAAHVVYDMLAPPMTPEATPGATEPVLLPTATTDVAPVESPATSTPAPTLAQPGNEEVVLEGEGIYIVCRRHCPGLWRLDALPPSLERYARSVAEINQLVWNDVLGGPILQPGDLLKMPPCPEQP